MRHFFPSLLMVLLIFTTSSTAMTYQLSENFDEPVIFSFKRSILVEERTAVWCPSCAEIDPELAEVAQGHGSRVALIGLHPDDGDDPFGNPASESRMDRQNTMDDSLVSTPTFLVDGVKTAEGYEAWQDVQRAILRQENMRQSPPVNEMEIVSIDDVIRLSLQTPDDGQITIMLLEHEKLVPEQAINPGASSRDRVLIDLVNLMPNGTIENTSAIMNVQVEENNISLTFIPPKSFSLVVIAEPTITEMEQGADRTPIGVVEIARKSIIDLNENSILHWLMVGGLLLGTLIIYRRSDKGHSEEE
jgi:thiol-disulfide isomerase/thioredoxin